MLFNSYEFLIFLPIVWATYWLLPRRTGVQNALLLVASYVFYAWWNVRFVWLIFIMTAASFLCGVSIGRQKAGSKRAQWACYLGVVSNLMVLGAFKYYNFFVESFNAAMHAAGFEICVPLWRMVLPIGISFYTFQLVGYMVDVYKGRISACHDALAFATFVSFFPQLVAGPIERANHLLPQMMQRRQPCYNLMADGARQMLWGFAKKMLLADRCAPLVASIYGNAQSDGTDLWAGTILFALQIYGDFSGYSDIAIGLGKMFGIQLTKNFATPYFSHSTNEFWRRWHISLMNWFRDYIYIPLGGSLRGIGRTLLNTFIVFTISGLWHGASYTFLAWGIYFAFWSSLGILLKHRHHIKHKSVSHPSLMSEQSSHIMQSTPYLAPSNCGRESLKGFLQMLLTFIVVCIGWVFFRSESIGAAMCRIGHMLTDVHLHTPYGGKAAWLAPIFFIVVEWFTRHLDHPLSLPAKGIWQWRAARWLTYYALLLATLYWGGQQVAFIYFQF